jgi:hypothetical protein
VVGVSIAALVAGCILIVAGVVWWARTGHERRLWRRAHHDAGKVAVMIELEEHVRDLEIAARTRLPGG